MHRFLFIPLLALTLLPSLRAQTADSPPSPDQPPTQKAPGPGRYKTLGLIRDASGQPLAHAEIHAYGDIRQGLPHPIDPDILQTKSDSKGRFRLMLLPGRSYRAFGFNLKSPGHFRVSDLSSPFFARSHVLLQGTRPRTQHTLRIQLSKEWRNQGPYRVELRPEGGTRRWTLSLPHLNKLTPLPILPGKRATLRLFNKKGKFLLATPFRLDVDEEIQGKGAYTAKLIPLIHKKPQEGIPLFLLCDGEALPLGTTGATGVLPFRIPSFQLSSPPKSPSNAYNPAPFSLLFFQIQSPQLPIANAAMGIRHPRRAGIPAEDFREFRFPYPKAQGRTLRIRGFDGRPYPFPKVFLSLPPIPYGDHPLKSLDPLKRSPRGIILRGDKNGKVFLSPPAGTSTLQGVLVQVLLNRKEYMAMPQALQKKRVRSTPLALVPIPPSTKPLSPFTFDLSQTKTLDFRIQPSSSEERESNVVLWTPLSPQKVKGQPLDLGKSHIRTLLGPRNRASLLLAPVPSFRYGILEPSKNYISGFFDLPSTPSIQVSLRVPPAVPIWGRILGETDHPLKGVTVTFFPETRRKIQAPPLKPHSPKAAREWFHSLLPNFWLRTQTDGQGRFALIFPAGYKKGLLMAQLQKAVFSQILVKTKPEEFQDLRINLK